MTTPITSPPPSALDERVRAALESCLGCGYTLTGLTAGGACPECGTVIPSVIDAHGAGTLPVDVIRRVRRSMKWYRAGFAALLGSVIVIIPVIDLQDEFEAHVVARRAMQFALLLLPIGAFIVQQRAWWIFAAPSSPEAVPPWHGAPIVRGLTIVITLIAIAGWITFGGHLVGVMRAPGDIELGLITAIGVLIALRAMLALRLIGRMTTRLFDPELPRWARVLVRLYLGGFGLLVAGIVAARQSSFDPEGVFVLSTIGAAILAILTTATFVELGQLMTDRDEAIRRAADARPPHGDVVPCAGEPGTEPSSR